jgi:hypothetical protein
LLVDQQNQQARRRELHDALTKKRRSFPIECLPPRNGETDSSASYGPMSPLLFDLATDAL